MVISVRHTYLILWTAIAALAYQLDQTLYAITVANGYLLIWLATRHDNDQQPPTPPAAGT